MKGSGIYGTSRVLEPKHVLPTSAWRLDNSKKTQPWELRIAVKRIHIEITSFKEICLEANDTDEGIKQKIMDIVIRRGKLHNPVTDTGGLLYGEVDEIGPAYDNKKNFQIGEEVICNVSLTSVPLYIEKIISIDRAFGQIQVEGYCIVSDEVQIIRRAPELPIKLLMYILNESGTIYRIGTTAVGKRKFLVVGNNLLSNLLFGYAIRKVAREDAEIVCLLDRKTERVLRGGNIDKLVKKVFTEVYYLDILRPLECIEKIKGDGVFDLSVNCADIQGAETINILATKSGGTVIFANLINNYNIALYITEAISRQLDIRCADGYLEAYDEFDFEIVREMLPFIEGAEETTVKVSEDPAHPVGRKNSRIKRIAEGQTVMEDVVCDSRAMAVTMDEVMKVSKYDCNVMITGEIGTGKEKIAEIIRKNSNRNLQPFLMINCTTLNREGGGEILYGLERDGEEDTKGVFDRAENGTLLLDAIEELTPDMQAKLLRIIQDGEFYREGGVNPIKSNVRILSATNKNMEELIDKGEFRRDLYYRLSVMRIRVPSLRERTLDIPGLIRKFLQIHGEKLGLKRTINRDAVEYLSQLDWPGNTRELETVVQRLMMGSTTESITLIDVMRELHQDVFDKSFPQVGEGGEMIEEVSLDVMVESFEKNVIRHALEKYGSTRKAAKAIGISQTQLVRKKNKYSL